MRAFVILILLLSKSLCEEIDSVRVIHDYRDPAAEAWEINVYGGSKIVADEEPESVDAFDFKKLETHAKVGGMPVAFYFHPQENDLGHFVKTLIVFLDKANRFSLQYTATLVVPGKPGLTLRTSITRPDSSTSLVVAQNLNQWILNGETVSANAVLRQLKASKGELAITINREAFETMKSIDTIRDLIAALNRYDDLGRPVWIYSIKINS